MDEFQKDDVKKNKFKNFKKCIAGFRSGNPRSEKNAKTYYILIVALMAIGSSWKLNDFAMLLTLLIAPSVFYNFKSMRAGKKGYGRIFALTLALFIATTAVFNATYIDENDLVQEDIETKIESNPKTEDKQVENEVTLLDNKDGQEDDNAIISTVNQSEIHFINTGNSDAILIKQGDKSALIDGGDNDDEDRVVSYLNQQGVTELEYVFATHPHADHIGGLDSVVDNISVKNIYVSNGDADTQTYSDFITSMANKGLNPSVPLLNSEFKLGTSIFKVLSVANQSDPNNNSLVLLYTNGEDKVLLMGDAESEIESKINVSDIDLLKVGHHGSHSSSNSNFIDKVNPQYAVITVGEDNKYGHPHKETMDTLENRGIEVHRNDECGHVVFKSTGEGLTVDCKVASYEPGEDKEVSIEVSPTPTPEPKPEVSVTPEPPAPEPEPVTKMVWLSATGDKAHSIPNCGRMNPDKARKVPDIGYDYCSKCW